ncbi:MAG TPA: hypothetical protein DIT89_02760, partial [Planctomycetaceae bacterium]|nr:hypothetical protein [Planctomycetaceae bacterium]
MSVLWAFAAAATFMLFWIYGGYGGFLQVLHKLHRHHRTPPAEPAPDQWPHVALLLTVHNESKVIRQRLENLLALDYPTERL